MILLTDSLRLVISALIEVIFFKLTLQTGAKGRVGIFRP